MPADLAPPPAELHADSPAALADLLRELKAIRALLAAGQAELLPAAQAAALCGLSRPTWLRLRSAAKTPAPVRVNGSVRWRRADLLRWVELGCPDRQTFEARK